MTRKSAFKHILQRCTRISFGSGAGFTLPQLLPACFRVIPGGLCCWLRFTRSCRVAGLPRVPSDGPLLIGWRFPGPSRGGIRKLRESTTS
nr:MAG TPA: hypothetical protein [Caudoviricetes sp.]